MAQHPYFIIPDEAQVLVTNGKYAPDPVGLIQSFLLMVLATEMHFSKRVWVGLDVDGLAAKWKREKALVSEALGDMLQRGIASQKFDDQQEKTLYTLNVDDWERVEPYRAVVS